MKDIEHSAMYIVNKLRKENEELKRAIKENYIEKDKIREKLEEIEEEYIKEDAYECVIQIELLKLLLEE